MRPCDASGSDRHRELTRKARELFLPPRPVDGWGSQCKAPPPEPDDDEEDSASIEQWMCAAWPDQRTPFTEVQTAVAEYFSSDDGADPVRLGPALRRWAGPDVRVPAPGGVTEQALVAADTIRAVQAAAPPPKRRTPITVIPYALRRPDAVPRSVVIDRVGSRIRSNAPGHRFSLDSRRGDRSARLYTLLPPPTASREVAATARRPYPA